MSEPSAQINDTDTPDDTWTTYQKYNDMYAKYYETYGRKVQLIRFDATGKWRTLDAGTPIDSTGVLPNGTKFEGPTGLRDALLARKEQFVQAMTQKLLAYALGRQIEAYDMPAVRKVVHDAGKDDYRWRSIIDGIVKSEPFLMRTAPIKQKSQEVAWAKVG